jgi:hypothetical protein
MAGALLHVVARNLRHADTRCVKQHYSHLAPSYVADEIRRAAPRFGLEPGNVQGDIVVLIEHGSNGRSVESLTAIVVVIDQPAIELSHTDA